MQLLMLSMLLVACKKPPTAPEGLDDSMKHLFRGYYGSDEDIGAGLTGLMNWFDREGYELLDTKADLNNVGAFELSTLAKSDVQHLERNDDTDPSTAPGVVSLAEMDCRWREAEGLLVRRDQEVVFEGDFDTYDRDYVSSRKQYEQASSTGEYDPISEVIDPNELDAVPASLLRTYNETQASELGVTISFDLVLHFRHGSFVVQDEDTSAFLVLSWIPERAESDGGANSMEQNFSIDVNLQREKGRTLRVFANWTEVHSPWFDSDSAIVLSSAVNKSQKSAERLGEICAGEEQIPPE